jgi:hypothetical protein
MALERARVELALAPPILLHPFPTILRADEPWAEARLLDFNTYDSVTVAGIVRAATTYRLCATDVAGSCRLADGEIALIVSNLLEVERDALGLILIAMDRRSGGLVHRSYSVRVKHSLGEWQLVEFRLVDR